jgi:hypothetical protein
MWLKSTVMKTIQSGLILLAFGIVMTACGNQKEENPPPTPPPAAQPEPEEKFKIKLENDSFGIEYEKQK